MSTENFYLPDPNRRDWTGYNPGDPENTITITTSADPGLVDHLTTTEEEYQHLKALTIRAVSSGKGFYCNEIQVG